jgi:hypothetical protein
LAIPHSIIGVLLESVGDNITNLGDGDGFVKRKYFLERQLIIKAVNRAGLKPAPA